MLAQHKNIVGLNGYYFLLQAQARVFKIDGDMIFSRSTPFVWAPDLLTPTLKLF